VEHTGSFRSPAEARKILVFHVEGVEVAFLAYAYGTNGIPSPHPWSVNLISLGKVVADARRARRLGADLVIVNFHWGDEYVHTPVEHPSFVVQPISGRVATSLVRTAATSTWARDLLDSYRRTVGYAGIGPHVHPLSRLRTR